MRNFDAPYVAELHDDPAWDRPVRSCEPTVEELGRSERDEFYITQMLARFCEKSFNQQYSDAGFADLNARGIEEYDTDPREEACAHVDGWLLDLHYDLDSPWEAPGVLQPQFDLFDQLDRELPPSNWRRGPERLSTDHEPASFPPFDIDDEQLYEVLESFQTNRKLCNEAGEVYTVEQLSVYYRERSAEIARHANDRIRKIRENRVDVKEVVHA